MGHTGEVGDKRRKAESLMAKGAQTQILSERDFLDLMSLSGS